MNLFHADKKFQRFEEISPEILKKAGVKLLLCDLDNTVRLHSEKAPSCALIEWTRKCQQAGIKIVIVSNNGRKKMMQKFCKPLKVPCVWFAFKPASFKILRTIKKYKFKPEETLMLGDKWTTDVVAANLSGIRAWKLDHRRNFKKSL